MARLPRLGLIALVALAAFAGRAHGGAPVRSLALSRPPAETPVVDATPIPEASALKLDGELTDAVWEQAPVVSGFLQREPQEGAPATLDTEFRVAYDDTHLYVAVRAHDPDPDQLVGILTRRDGQSPSDWIRVFIDSYFDRRTAFEFAVNPVGVKQDRYWFNDTSDDDGWDAVWDVEVRRDTRGWQAEFRIPFSQLRFTPNEDGRFGIAVDAVWNPFLLDAGYDDEARDIRQRLTQRIHVSGRDKNFKFELRNRIHFTSGLWSSRP